jgi:hypothetical protein
MTEAPVTFILGWQGFAVLLENLNPFAEDLAKLSIHLYFIIAVTAPADQGGALPT